MPSPDSPPAARPDVKVLLGSPAAGRLPVLAGQTPPAGTILLDLGPDHPSRAGLVELDLWTDGELITAADVRVGAMHRGVEKLFEVRDYRQVLMLADRHDWQAPYNGELTVALAAEDMLGLEVPPRALWLRTLLAEVTRISSHAGFLGWLARQAPGETFTGARLAALREEGRQLMRDLTGNRIHPMIIRLGGLAADTPEGWIEAVVAWAARASTLAQVARTVAADLPAGVAVINTDQVNMYGLSGPTARGSGVDADLRRHQPYLAYGELTITPDGPTTGDAAARFGQLAVDLINSAQLITDIAARLETVDGPVGVKLPKIIKLPEGETWLNTEAPLGIAGVHLVSRGDKTPWRLKLRTPSFAQVASLTEVLVGVDLPSLELALASLGHVVGDIDR
ncbi:NADH-quinone oxidoreductase subunit D [Propionibacteriaceae bacterium Y1700]|uniref:NADH-quinone oxidoreductase subunit D-related protein n=1 Tax=Microlunatus sp. Y1700 TaxID=3418487 RepID=UPI003DA6CE47